MLQQEALALDAAGVPVLEVTHGDGLGGSSFNYGFSRTPEQELIKIAAETATRAKIAFLMLPGVGTKDDIREAQANGGSICRIATHCTEADVSEQHFGLARDLGLETVGFLMLSHRIGPDELAGQARIMADAGCQCVYVVDSAGALLPDGVRDQVVCGVPVAGPLVQARHLVGVLGEQARAQDVGEQVVVAVPTALGIEGNQEQVAALEVLEHPGAVGAASDRVAQGSGEALEDGGVDEEVADL